MNINIVLLKSRTSHLFVLNKTSWYKSKFNNNNNKFSSLCNSCQSHFSMSHMFICVSYKQINRRKSLIYTFWVIINLILKLFSLIFLQPSQTSKALLVVLILLWSYCLPSAIFFLVLYPFLCWSSILAEQLYFSLQK